MRRHRLRISLRSQTRNLNYMKVIVISLVVLFFSCLGKGSNMEYIKIEHVGERDKPITTVIISHQDFPIEDLEKLIIVSEQSFDKIYGSIYKIKTELKLEDRKVSSNEWEVFRITYKGVKEDLTFVTSKKEESIQCFKQLSDELLSIRTQDGMENVIHELQILLRRIGEE
jgi:hypothetical protein